MNAIILRPVANDRHAPRGPTFIKFLNCVICGQLFLLAILHPGSRILHHDLLIF